MVRDIKNNKMKKLFKELKEIDSLIAHIFQKNPKLANTKFAYACKKFADKNYVSIAKEQNDKVFDIRIQNALEDKNTKEVLFDKDPEGRGFKFSKEGLTNCIKQEREVIAEFDKKEVEVEPYICTNIPEELTDAEKEELNGLIINYKNEDISTESK